MVIRIHQRRFSNELITVRSVYFFNHITPFIQLWRSEDCPGQDRDVDFTKVQEYFWQRAFYRVVREGSIWHQLEDDELIFFNKFLYENRKITSVRLQVVEAELPNNIVFETLIDNN